MLVKGGYMHQQNRNGHKYVPVLVVREAYWRTRDPMRQKQLEEILTGHHNGTDQIRIDTCSSDQQAILRELPMSS